MVGRFLVRFDPPPPLRCRPGQQMPRRYQGKKAGHKMKDLVEKETGVKVKQG